MVKRRFLSLGAMASIGTAACGLVWDFEDFNLATTSSDGGVNPHQDGASAADDAAVTWCSSHTPTNGQCWDFDLQQAIPQDFSLKAADEANATIGPPSQPTSLPNGFHATATSFLSTIIIHQLDAGPHTELSFSLQIDPNECVTADGNRLGSVALAYVAFGSGVSSKPPFVLFLALQQDNSLSAFYELSDAGSGEATPLNTCGPCGANACAPCASISSFEAPTGKNWYDVTMDIKTSSSMTAAYLNISVNGKEATYTDVPITPSATITIGLGVAPASVYVDGGTDIQSCKASFDNVTLVGE